MTSSTVRRELILVSAAHSGCGGDSAPLPAPGAGGRAMKFDEFFQRINNVTLKLTAGCNLHCTYCNAEAETPKTPRMSMECFKQTARLLVANSRSPFVGMEFHGGEPLLLPDEWFEEAVAYGRALGEQHHKRVNFAFVTNGTLLTEERLVRLNKLSVHFCMSADGPPEINDSVRGGGHAVERALLLFRRLRIRHSVLTVMSRGNFRRMTQVLDWFKDIGVSDVRVNFVEPQGRGNDEAQLLSGEEMFEGMRQVLDHLDRTGVSVREAEMLMAVDRFLYGRDAKPQLSCWEVQCQAGRSYVAVDHEGVVHPCGSDVRSHPMGQIDADLDLERDDAVLRRLHDKGDWVIRCFDCNARKICRHSCPTSDFNSKNYREYECRFTKLMYQHLYDHPDQARRIDAALQARRRGWSGGAATT